MSEADKMFNVLGYIKTENKDIPIIVYKESEILIQFNLLTKNVDITNIISMQELQAINEKVKELRLE